MSIAEEQIKQIIQGMTEDEKRFTAKYLDSKYMQAELIKRETEKGEKKCN